MKDSHDVLVWRSDGKYFGIEDYLKLDGYIKHLLDLYPEDVKDSDFTPKSYETWVSHSYKLANKKETLKEEQSIIEVKNNFEQLDIGNDSD